MNAYRRAHAMQNAKLYAARLFFVHDHKQFFFSKTNLSFICLEYHNNKREKMNYFFNNVIKLTLFLTPVTPWLLLSLLLIYILYIFALSVKKDILFHRNPCPFYLT